MDRGHDTVMYQVRTLARRYARVVEHLPSDFGLIVAVAGERRYQLYRKWAARPVARPFTQDTFEPYQLRALVPQVHVSYQEEQQEC